MSNNEELIAEARKVEDKARQFDTIKSAVQDYINGRPLDDVFGEIVIAALRDDFSVDAAIERVPDYPIATALEQADAEISGLREVAVNSTVLGIWTAHEELVKRGCFTERTLDILEALAEYTQQEKNDE